MLCASEDWSRLLIMGTVVVMDTEWWVVAEYRDSLTPIFIQVTFWLIKSGYVIGLIDWTEEKVPDVSNEFVVHYRILGEEFLKLIINVFKEAGGYVLPSMKEHVNKLEKHIQLGSQKLRLYLAVISIYIWKSKRYK